MEHWEALRANPTSALDDQIWSAQILLSAYQALDPAIKGDKVLSDEGLRIWFAKNSHLLPNFPSTLSLESPQLFPSVVKPSISEQAQSLYFPHEGQSHILLPQLLFNNCISPEPTSATPQFRVPFQPVRGLQANLPLQPPPKPEWRTSDALPSQRVDIAQMVTHNQDILCRSSGSSRRASNHLGSKSVNGEPGPSGRVRSWTLPPPEPTVPAPIRQHSAPFPCTVPSMSPPRLALTPRTERMQLEQLLAQKQQELQAFQFLVQQRLPTHTSQPGSAQELHQATGSAEIALERKNAGGSPVLSRSLSQPAFLTPLSAPSTTPCSPELPPNRPLNKPLKTQQTQSLQNNQVDEQRSELANSPDRMQRNGGSPKSDSPQPTQQFLEQQVTKLQAEAGSSLESQYQLSLVQQQLLALKFGQNRPAVDQSPKQALDPSSQGIQERALRGLLETSSNSPPLNGIGQHSEVQRARSAIDIPACQDESKKNKSDRKKLRAAIKSSRTIIGAIYNAEKRVAKTENPEEQNVL